MHRALRKWLKSHAYKVHIITGVRADCYQRVSEVRGQCWFSEDNSVFRRSEISCKLLVLARIWGSEKPQTGSEHNRDSSTWMFGVHYAITPWAFFVQKCANANVYADIFKNYAILQLQDMQFQVFFWTGWSTSSQDKVCTRAAKPSLYKSVDWCDLPISSPSDLQTLLH